jgi:hypothetical protein
MLDKVMLREEMRDNGISDMSVESYALFRDMSKGHLIATIGNLIDQKIGDEKDSHREGYELGRVEGHRAGYEEARSLS